MAAMSLAGAGPRAGGSSPSATSGPSVRPKPASSGGGAAFPKAARLLKRAEFRRVYDNGRRLTSPSFAMFFAPRSASEPAAGDLAAAGAQGPRAGFTTPKALGKSVVRNRIKRRMREAVRLEIGQFAASIDYVFHPRRSLLDVAFPQLRREVSRKLRDCEASLPS